METFLNLNFDNNVVDQQSSDKKNNAYKKELEYIKENYITTDKFASNLLIPVYYHPKLGYFCSNVFYERLNLPDGFSLQPIANFLYKDYIKMFEENEEGERLWDKFIEQFKGKFPKEEKLVNINDNFVTGTSHRGETEDTDAQEFIDGFVKENIDPNETGRELRFLHYTTQLVINILHNNTANSDEEITDEDVKYYIKENSADDDRLYDDKEFIDSISINDDNFYYDDNIYDTIMEKYNEKTR